jgi:hypothetical protein
MATINAMSAVSSLDWQTDIYVRKSGARLKYSDFCRTGSMSRWCCMDAANIAAPDIKGLQPETASAGHRAVRGHRQAIL